MSKAHLFTTCCTVLVNSYISLFDKILRLLMF